MCAEVFGRQEKRGKAAEKVDIYNFQRDSGDLDHHRRSLI